MGRRRQAVSIGVAATVAGCLALACTTDELVVQSGIPGARASAAVALVAERGDWLDLTSQSGGRETRFFVPNDEACRSLFAGEQVVTYSNSGGRFGSLQAGDQTCSPVGVLSLAQWRDRRPRRQSASIIPRSRAEFRERVYLDEDLVLIRGRFPQAAQIEIVGTDDLIAVIPNIPECQGFEVPGESSIEFRATGRQPFTLINGRQLCPLLGFVLVPPNA
jgi:hypothetical protein